MKDERDIFKSWIQNIPDESLIEKVNEINRYENGISEFVYDNAKSIHGDTDFVIQCVFDEYDKRKKRLDFVVLILCNWIKNLIKMK